MKKKYFTFLLSPILFSCGSGLTEDYARQESPTTGETKIIADLGLKHIMSNQVFTFGKLYDRTKIETSYLPENEAIQYLFNDSCKAIFINRDLSENEKAQFLKANIHLTSTPLCSSAIVLLCNNTYPDSLISVEKLKQMIASRDEALGKIVFEHAGAGSALFVKDSLLGKTEMGKNCFAVQSVTELLNYLKTESNAIGILDYNWISDQDEPLSKEIRKNFKILAVKKENGTYAFMPDQSNIKTGDYPLTRKVFGIRRSADFSLAAGLIAFIAGQKGQLMMLKSGLVPAFDQERVIELNTGENQPERSHPLLQ